MDTCQAILAVPTIAVFASGAFLGCALAMLWARGLGRRQ